MQTKTYHAVKIIKNRQEYMLQGLVETKILEKLNKRDKCMNIIKMQEYFVYKEFLCIVFELLM